MKEGTPLRCLKSAKRSKGQRVKAHPPRIRRKTVRRDPRCRRNACAKSTRRIGVARISSTRRAHGRTMTKITGIVLQTMILGKFYRVCPQCKESRQAIQKIDIWKLPEILVVFLSRFRYDGRHTSKIETFVGFPIDGLTCRNSL